MTNAYKMTTNYTAK